MHHTQTTPGLEDTNGTRLKTNEGQYSNQNKLGDRKQMLREQIQQTEMGRSQQLARTWFDTLFFFSAFLHVRGSVCDRF